MKGIIVARLKCGCVASAWFDYQEKDTLSFAESVIEWLESGYVISLEDRDTIYAEKCKEHTLQV